ncbi:MAG: purine-nucleoside phosphorylase [Nautilia sp.]|nr:MAG: purine-nucleoside phosphorylase [Nautilia sp.]
MILSAGKEEIFSFARPIGIGLIESAINLTHICLLDRPNSLIFIGSAGSYNPEKYKIFDIIISSTASQIEISFLQKKSYTPIDNFITASSQKEVVVNSSNYITTDKISALAFDKLGFNIENMEFYSVVKIAKEFNIPVRGIFVITNYCDENAHKDYLKNIKTAKEKLINYLTEKGYIK